MSKDGIHSSPFCSFSASVSDFDLVGLHMFQCCCSLENASVIVSTLTILDTCREGKSVKIDEDEDEDERVPDNQKAVEVNELGSYWT